MQVLWLLIVLHCCTARPWPACRYFDMLRDVGANNRSSTLFLSHAPGGVADIGSQIRSAFLESSVATKQPPPAAAPAGR